MATSDFYIFLLAGQSNMAGRGFMNSVPEIADDRILMFRDGLWQMAREPLHTDKPEIAGIGLAMSFAARVLEARPGAKVGLLPCAVGGTPLVRWMPGEDLGERALATVRQSCTGQPLAAVLWHQGENDCLRPADAATYGERLRAMIAGWRHDLRYPGLPFIAGELGPFLQQRDECRETWEGVNLQLRHVIQSTPGCALAEAIGLTDNGDALHFNGPSLREFGRRYAELYLSMTGTYQPPGDN